MVLLASLMSLTQPFALDDWTFDIFELERVCKHPLKFAAYSIFEKYDFKAAFSLDKTALERFLCSVESGYHANRYHNNLHGADVLQTMHYFLRKGVAARISIVVAIGRHNAAEIALACASTAARSSSG